MCASLCVVCARARVCVCIFACVHVWQHSITLGQDIDAGSCTRARLCRYWRGCVYVCVCVCVRACVCVCVRERQGKSTSACMNTTAQSMDDGRCFIPPSGWTAIVSTQRQKRRRQRVRVHHQGHAFFVNPFSHIQMREFVELYMSNMLLLITVYLVSQRRHQRFGQRSQPIQPP